MTRLSENMVAALRLTKMFGKGSAGTYMPYATDTRTFDALERRGLVIYNTVDQPGVSYNGYSLTDAGRAAITGNDEQEIGGAK